MQLNGKMPKTASSLPADLDPSAPLGGYLNHDEHHPFVPLSDAAACAGNRSRAFDIAGAGDFSGRSQSSVLANLFSGSCDGARGARDRMVQAVRTVSRFGRTILDRTWRGILAAWNRRARCGSSAMTSYQTLILWILSFVCAAGVAFARLSLLACGQSAGSKLRTSSPLRF